MAKVTITIEDKPGQSVEITTVFDPILTPKSRATGAHALALQAHEILTALNREVRDTMPVLSEQKVKA